MQFLDLTRAHSINPTIVSPLFSPPSPCSSALRERKRKERALIKVILSLQTKENQKRRIQIQTEKRKASMYARERDYLLYRPAKGGRVDEQDAAR
jgi:hypothetical protein